MENTLLVKIIEPNATRLHHSLGFSDERTAELSGIIGEIIINSIIKSKGTDEVLVEISQHAKHPNELAFLCFSIGKVITEANHNPSVLIGAAMASKASLEDILKIVGNK